MATAGVRTIMGEDSSIQEAVDNGREALSGALYSFRISPEAIIALSAQTVRDPESGRWFHVMTLVFNEDSVAGT